MADNQRQKLLRDLADTARDHWEAHEAAVTKGEITPDIEERLNEATEAHERAMRAYDRLGDS